MINCVRKKQIWTNFDVKIKMLTFKNQNVDKKVYFFWNYDLKTDKSWLEKLKILANFDRFSYKKHNFDLHGPNFSQKIDFFWNDYLKTETFLHGNQHSDLTNPENGQKNCHFRHFDIKT